MDTQIQEAAALLRNRLKEHMREKNMEFVSELSRATGANRTQIERFLRSDNETLPSDESLIKIRSAVKKITDDDARKIGEAFSRRMSLGRRAGALKRWGPDKMSKPAVHKDRPAKTSLARAIGLEESDNISLSEKIRLMWKILGPQIMASMSVTESEPAPPPVQGQYLIDPANYEVDGVPNVLTKNNFQHIDFGSVSKSDVESFLQHTIRMLQEAQKCMVVLAQLPEEYRTRVLHLIGRHADLFLRTLKVASHVAPMEFIGDVDLGRLAQSIRQEKTA